MFPNGAETGKREENPGIALLGNRIIADQTLYEYLIEFLLIFASPKAADGSGAMRFHNAREIAAGKLPYYVALRAPLRRFIFYDRSKQTARSGIDTLANAEMNAILREAAKDNEDSVDLMHDLLINYAIITRNRGWYAQAVMPVAPTLLMTDLQGIKERQRCSGSMDTDDSRCDTLFDYNKHNFLGRGGQVLYLHLLQGMAARPEADAKYRARLEALLRNMLDLSGAGTERIARFVEDEWERAHDDAGRFDAKPFNMGYITGGYELRSERFLMEITNFLSAQIHPVTRIELLSQGLVFSLMRAMQIVAEKRIDPAATEPVWIIDVTARHAGSNVSRLSARSFERAYASFGRAMMKICRENGLTDEDGVALLQSKKAVANSADVFKRLGKEMRFIVPPKGANERFSLKENLLRYLVLALVAPGKKMMLDSFLEKLYEHFRIVIAPSEYRRAVREGAWDESADMAEYFSPNAAAFQELLKSCGFLRDLSDATAIVENPYSAVEIKEA